MPAKRSGRPEKAAATKKPGSLVKRAETGGRAPAGTRKTRGDATRGGANRAAAVSGAQAVDEVIAELRALATDATRDGMSRFGIPSDNAFGVTMGDVKQLAKRLGKNHALAGELWKSGWYEARMLASLIDDPRQVTPAQMDRWCRDFDNWAICDTVCFNLFDRTPHAFRKIAEWRNEQSEFGRRAAFALLACVALHDKQAPDEPFAEGLIFVREAATDERNFVKKAVNWALRAIGGRSASLHAAALALARTLAESTDVTARWIGKDAVRELGKKKRGE